MCRRQCEALKGTPVVLEFWATWRPPCREQIPHLNRMAETYKNARFISITDEEPDLIQRFLKEFPISGWIGIVDASGIVCAMVRCRSTTRA